MSSSRSDPGSAAPPTRDVSYLDLVWFAGAGRSVFAFEGGSLTRDRVLQTIRPNDVCLLLFSEWLLSDHHAVLIAMMDIEDTFRVDADCFLARSLTAMNVHLESSKDVFVSTSESVYHYLCYWSLRPVATLIQPVRLTHHRNARRKFGQLLRQEWMLNYGTFKMAAEISDDETHQRAFRSRTCDLAWLHCLSCLYDASSPGQRSRGLQVLFQSIRTCA